MGAVPALQAIPAELFKELLIVHPIRGFVVGDLGVAELEIKIALICDDLGVGASLRHHGEQIVHLIRRLDVEFVGLELHFVGVLHGLAGLDAKQDALHLGIVPAQIVSVVRSRHGDARFPRQLDELG